jgi:hypothetical protein
MARAVQTIDVSTLVIAGGTTHRIGCLPFGIVTIIGCG